MKVFKLGLRLWITITSLLSFGAGWILLAHAPKPVQPASATNARAAAPMPTLAPLPPLDFGAGQGGQTFESRPLSIQIPNPAVSMPVFRTGGS